MLELLKWDYLLMNVERECKTNKTKSNKNVMRKLTFTMCC